MKLNELKPAAKKVNRNRVKQPGTKEKGGKRNDE